MINGSLRPVSRLICLVLLVPVAHGCFEYSESINIRPDGSGTVEITASIPEVEAVKYRQDTYAGPPPAPVTEAVITQLMVGSANVTLVTHDVQLDNDVWKYNVVLDFDSISSLASVRYFKQRNMRLTFSGPKELHFRQDLYPSLVKMAADEARTGLKEYPYSKPFLAVVDAQDFAKTIEKAKLRYQVIVPGVRVVPGFDGGIESPAAGLVGVSKDYKIADFLQTNIKQIIDFRATQPEETGFTPLVVALLLASIVGILIPAVRLLVIKSKGGA